MRFRALAFGLLSATLTAHASMRDIYFEAGGAAGTPGGLNLVFGSWGTLETPLLVRLSAGSTLLYNGAELQVGWVFKRERKIQQYASLGAAIHYWYTESYGDGTFNEAIRIGPALGCRYGAFFIEGGMGITVNSHYPTSPVFPFLQIGFSSLSRE